MTTTLERADLQNAIDILSRRADRLGDDVLSTTLAVLRERLSALIAAPAAAGSATPAEQRKQVTILFASVEGLTAWAERLPESKRVSFINRLWSRIDDTVAFHGGLVDKHMGDVVMCLFGAPVAGENDAERAVRCALALVDSVSGFLSDDVVDAPGDNSPNALTIRVGVNTGLVVLGQVGLDDSLTVIGDPVNVASRLKDAAAESGVYISHETFRLVEPLFQVEPLGLLPVRGRRTPVTVYRVGSARPRAFFAARLGVRGVAVPMVGRGREMEQLQLAVVDALRQGRGRFLTIVGEAGVGKSRLAGEFNRWLEDFPVRPVILGGLGEQRLQSVPLGMLQNLVGDLGAASEPAVVGRQAKTAGARVFPRRRLPWSRLPGSAAAVLPSPLAGSDADGLIAQLGDLVHRAPLTIAFLEDIHWADDDSLSLLERLAQLAYGSPLVIIALARPALLERRPDWPQATAGPSGGAIIHLRPLDEAESLELVRHILRHLATIPDELSDLIVRASGGNPYYVEELIKVLIDDGLIVAGEDQWVLRSGQLPRLRVPATLTGVLQARLDRLPEPERVTLQQAAVVGAEFWDTAVGYINRSARRPLPDEQLSAALQSLEGRELIYRADSHLADAAAYRFKHNVLHEVAYDSVLLRDRPLYHLAAARWLEMESEALGNEYAGQIALHYERGGEVARAAAAYQQAAAWAETRYNAPGAIEYYHKVLALVGELPQFIERRLRAYERLGAMLYRQGRLDEALESYRSMRDVAELDGNLLMHARSENALAAVYGDRHDQPRMLSHAGNAAQAAWLTGSDSDLIQALLLQATAEAEGGHTAQAIDLAEEAAQMALVQQMGRESVRALALAGRLRVLAGQLPEARATVDRLRAETERLRRAGRDVAAAMGRFLEAELQLQLNDKTAAIEAAVAVFDSAENIDDRDVATEAMLVAARILLASGEPTRAQAMFEEASRAAEMTGHALMRRQADVGLAEALLVGVDAAAAETRLRAMLTGLDEQPGSVAWVLRGEVGALLALALCDTGSAEAVDVAVDALVAAVDVRTPAGMALALTALGEALGAEPDRPPVPFGEESLTAMRCFELARPWLDVAAAGGELAHRRRRLLLAWAAESERRGYGARAAGLRVQAAELG